MEKKSEKLLVEVRINAAVGAWEILIASLKYDRGTSTHKR